MIEKMMELNVLCLAELFFFFHFHALTRNRRTKNVQACPLYQQSTHVHNPVQERSYFLVLLLVIAYISRYHLF